MEPGIEGKAELPLQAFLDILEKNKKLMEQNTYFKNELDKQALPIIQESFEYILMLDNSGIINRSSSTVYTHAVDHFLDHIEKKFGFKFDMTYKDGNTILKFK